MAENPEAKEDVTAGNMPRWRRPAPSDGSYPFHPFLFAVASVMIIMARNLDHTSFVDILPSLSGALLFALVVYLLVAALRRRFDRLSAVIASIWVVGCLFYAGLFGRINDWVEGSFSMVKSLPFALAVLIITTVLALLLRKAAGVIHSILNGVAVVLLISPIWQAASYEWGNGAARSAYDPDKAMSEIAPYAPAPAVGDTSRRPPDIYHFIFDRYASEPVLKKYYDLDNSAIGRFLEQNGFYVARDSNSNYPKTGPSIASTFYMDYLDLLAEDERVEGSNWHPIYKMLDDHRVARFLKSRGYEMIQFGSWWVGTHDNPVADENHPHGFSEFEMIYLRTTALRPLFHVLPDTELTSRLDWDNAQCQRIRPQVEEIKAIGNRSKRDKPLYVFAHFLLPHGPFNFTVDGRCLTLEEQVERGEEQGYLDAIAYANSIIEEIVTTLQNGDQEPPIILIQADEGPFPTRDYRIPWQEASVDELRIKSGILNAYYFPGQDYSALREDITPVNSYRILFNTYFGANFPLLPDRIFFFPNDANLYEYHDMTDKIRGPASIAGTTIGHPLHP